MKYYHYFRTNTGKLFKSESILRFDAYADKNNILDWSVVQFPEDKINAIEI